jgi:hypothetical protein
MIHSNDVSWISPVAVVYCICHTIATRGPTNKEETTAPSDEYVPFRVSKSRSSRK